RLHPDHGRPGLAERAGECVDRLDDRQGVRGEPKADLAVEEGVLHVDDHHRRPSGVEARPCRHQKNTPAARVATTSPETTGTKRRRTSSTTGTPVTPATAMSEDQTTRVPPPVHDAAFWPMAASVSGATPAAGPSASDRE